jgi:FkbM family methyltransferase
MASVSEAVSVGLDHYFADRKTEAAEIFRRILDAVPDQPQALRMAGVLAGERGELTEAVGLLRRAWRLSPADGDLACNLAQAQAGAGLQDEADATLIAAGPLFPADAAALAAGARKARRNGDSSRAYTLERRRARLSADTDAIWAMADDAEAAGHTATAQEARRALLSIGPWLEEVWSELAESAEKQGDLYNARRLFDRAFRLAPHRVKLSAALGRTRRAAGLDREYFSSDGQDALIHRMYFPRRRDGFFVDLGAYDGVTWSNSLFFERESGWAGLCVEASPARFKNYQASGRSAPCLNVAVGDQDGEAAFLEVVEGMTMTGGLLDAFAPEQRAYVEQNAGEQQIVTVPVRRLDGLLRERGVRHIDFLSADIEGAERAAVESLDPDEFTIDVMCLENLGADAALRTLLDQRGYDFICRFPGGDEIYVRRGFSPAG